jgi:protein CWC15
MTTAHRATWKAAKGGDGEQGSFRLHAPESAVAARDAPSHTALKTRAALEERPVRSTLRDELAARERAAKRARAVSAALQFPAVLHVTGPLRPGSGKGSAGLDDDVVLDDGDESDADDRDEGGRRGGAGSSRKTGSRASGHDDGGGDDSDDENDDESDDDDDELRAELARIRAERAAERSTADAAQAAIGNPLLTGLGSGSVAYESEDGSVAGAPSSVAFGVKRRWDDDVVFKNQARREARPEVRFINDTIRNDFHRRFLKRYVR